MKSDPDSVDWELLSRFYDGEVDAFDELFAKYFSPLRRHAMWILKDHLKAEDAVQETMVKLYFKRIERRTTLAAWLYRVCTRECINQIRKTGRELPLDFDGAGFDSIASVRNEHTTVEQESDIETCLNTLSQLERLVIELRDLEGYSNDETAHALNKSSGYISNIHKRATTKLLRGLGLPVDQENYQEQGTEIRSTGQNV